MARKCNKCGKKIGVMSASHPIDNGQEVCTDCLYIIREEKKLKKQEPPKSSPHSQIVITTSHILEGYRVIDTIEVITAECVFGMNIFRDMFAGLRDFVGGRSDATQKVLRDSRKTCLNELKKEAHSVGANAVIAVDLDYSEFSGGGKSMLMLIASGTAVKAEKIEDE